MIEMMLGAMVMALLVKAIPAAIVDTVTTLRAATAGEWGLIDKERDRKHQRAASRREAMSKAWQATRARRNKQAGGDGNYRPGMAAYFGDVYHGLWEDKLEKRHAKRAARPPVGPDGKRPMADRLDQAVEAKVGRQRTKAGYMGRAARLLWEPVGEPRQPADVVPPQTARRDDGGPAGTGAATPEPVDPWPFDGDDSTVEIPADGPRTACEHCGSSLVRDGDGWTHPAGAICPTTNRQEDPVTERLVDHVPATPASSPADRTEATDAAEAATHRLFESPTTGTYPNGGTAMTAATEIDTNEDARRAFATMAAAAAEANDAIAALEAAKAKMAAAANGTADGMSAKSFDADATTAAVEAADAISLGTLADWSERVDTVQAAAERGMRALDKYRDSEDMVASNNIDASTLAATSS